MKLTCFLLIVSVALISCKAKTAFEYSETIVRMESELSAEISAADKKLNEYLQADKIDSVVYMSRHMESLAENTLNEIGSMRAPNVPEGDSFKKAALAYFAYVKDIYTSFRKFSSARTEKEKDREAKKLAKIMDDRKARTLAMQAAQRKFAAANNFDLEKTARN